MVRWGLATLVVLMLGGMAYVRLAPSDPARWHHGADATGAGHIPRSGGHIWRGPGDADTLARLDRIIRATPRTQHLTGSLDDRMVTYVTRSRVFGFPDYTTISLDDGMVEVFARLRFGKSDLGVNRARVEGWLEALGKGG